MEGSICNYTPPLEQRLQPNARRVKFAESLLGALFPGVVNYYHTRDARRGTTEADRRTMQMLRGSVKERAALYAQYVTGELLLMIPRVGIGFLIYKLYFE